MPLYAHEALSERHRPAELQAHDLLTVAGSDAGGILKDSLDISIASGSKLSRLHNLSSFS